MSKRGRKPKGLGDVIDNITTATGIKAAVKFIAGEDCGCDERREKLNKAFPFKKVVVSCPSETQLEYLSKLFESNPHQLTYLQQRKISDIYSRVFGINIEPSNCGSCWRDYLNHLKTVYEDYTNNN